MQCMEIPDQIPHS
ncbi:hypothetical protein EYZ11_005488 [Aspergillus tanneri]|uniref:Uncharacterized protein n=1 Tax=Aspergillus tanneri TaxID=1220188 RepID=A0A4S3JIF9_9EURO|nr:hypothetical protein EYZ11_005488 [Aspergillus tanneri]